MTENGRPAADSLGQLPAHRARVPDDDHILLGRMAAGDESALARLYERWATRVHAVAMAILQDPDEAEDVVEETFYQVWRSAAQFDRERSTVTTWLVIIGRSRALDQLRRRRRRTKTLASGWVADQQIEGDAQHGAELAAAYAERISRSQVLAAELATLPPEQRTALELAFFSGLTHAEIATRTGIPLGTVKTRIRLAMQRLRERLSALRGEGL